jgi:hypothetical protein
MQLKLVMKEVEQLSFKDDPQAVNVFVPMKHRFTGLP